MQEAERKRVALAGGVKWGTKASEETADDAAAAPGGEGAAAGEEAGGAAAAAAGGQAPAAASGDTATGCEPEKPKLFQASRR